MARIIHDSNVADCVNELDAKIINCDSEFGVFQYRFSDFDIYCTSVHNSNELVDFECDQHFY